MKELGSLIPVPGAPSSADERDDPRDGSGAVARRGEAGAALSPELERPAWSQAAAKPLWEFMHPHPQVGLRWELVTPSVEAEAKRMLPRLRRRAAVATLEEWHMFSRRVAAMTANPPMNKNGVRAFDATVAEVHGSVMRGTCAGALVDGLAECQREEYFPKGAALQRILGPLHRQVLAELQAAENLARGDVLGKAKAKRDLENPPATDAERAAVRIRVAEAEAVREEQAKANREQMREAMAKYGHMPHETRVYAMEKELAEIDAEERRLGSLAPARVERRSHLRLRLTNIALAERGEPAIPLADWLSRQAAAGGRGARTG